MGRNTSVLLLLTISSFFIVANAKGNPSEIKQCRLINESAQRLACYDNIGSTSEYNNDSTKETSTTSSNSQNVSSPVHSSNTFNDTNYSDVFGFEEKEIAKQMPDSININVAEESLVHGKWVFKLSNGQIWRQLDNKRFKLRNENGQTYIERGAMGSFFLSQRDTKVRIRVRRVE